MKKSLPIVLTLLAGAFGLYAQGQIEWDDYAPNNGIPKGSDGFEITVWSPNPANPSVQTFGNGAADVPAGTQTYPGSVPIGGSSTGSGPTGYGNGNNYSIALYAAAGANQTALTAVPGAQATFSTAFGGSWLSSGGVDVTVPVASGAVGTFQLAAWYNGGGTITLAQAETTTGIPWGLSTPANITLNGPPNVPSTLNPITSFSLTTTVTPEPSTIALGLVGASAFLMRLRRKQ